MLSANQVALAYLIASVFFILALKGLSSPLTSRRGNLFGMIGMAIAVATTLTLTQNWVLIIGGIMSLGGLAFWLIVVSILIKSLAGGKHRAELAAVAAASRAGRGRGRRLPGPRRRQEHQGQDRLTSFELA